MIGMNLVAHKTVLFLEKVVTQLKTCINSNKRVGMFLN